MKTAVIICNGEFPKKEYPRYLIRSADFIICCDGAADNFLRNSKAVFGEERMPDAVIGDMDSISATTKRKFEGLLIPESGQDNNDQSKAVEHIVRNMPEVSMIYILGAGGKREDHTIGNLSLLMEYARMYGSLENAPVIEYVSDYSTAFAITDSTSIHCGIGRSVSIFSPDNSLRISSSGLHWKTDDVVFDNWWKATLNRADEDEVVLKFSHPSIALVILD